MVYVNAAVACGADYGDGEPMKTQDPMVRSLLLGTTMLACSLSLTARAQTVVNLSNLDAAVLGTTPAVGSFADFSTSLDLLNTSTALSNGGLFGGAVSILPSQQGSNQVNTIGITATGDVSPVALGIAGATPTVTINEITSAYNQTPGPTTATFSYGSEPLGTNFSSSSGQATVGGYPYNYSVNTTNNTITLTATVNGGGVPVPSTSALATTMAGGGGNGSQLSTLGSQLGNTSTVAGGTSTTINNINAAVLTGVNSIVGAAPPVNVAFTGGYGSQPGSVAAGGSQIGVNTLNGVAATFASGTSVSLSQIPGGPQISGSGFGSTIVQGSGGSFDPTSSIGAVTANLNMSVVNTLLGYSANGAASVNGALGTGQSAGSQTATNQFNFASLSGADAVAVQQSAAFPTQTPSIDPSWTMLPSANSLQTVNRAIAYNGQLGDANVGGGATSIADTVGVSNLNQIAANNINTLNLAPVNASTSGSSTVLTGVQSSNSPWIIAVNQAVAATGVNQANTAIFEDANGNANWSGFVSSIAPNLPSPGSVSSLAAQPFTGNASLSNLGQNIGVSLNTVNAGTNVQTGSTGFTQSIGGLGLASSIMNDANSSISAGWQLPGQSSGLVANVTPFPINSGVAVANAGSAMISTLGQNFQATGNLFTALGNVTGSTTQSVGTFDYNNAGLLPASEQPLYGASGMTPYGGARITEGASGSANYGPLTASPNSLTGPALNGAYSVLTNNGVASLTSVAQTAVGLANTLQAAGTINSGASGAISQSVGTIANYGGNLNTQIAVVGGGGTASITAPSQTLAFNANSISGGAGVYGQITQSAPSAQAFSYLQPTNAMAAANTNAGSARITGVALNGSAGNLTQSNTLSLNSIASGGSLGATTSVAAVSQSAPSVSFVIDGVTPIAANIVQAASWRPGDNGVTMSSTSITSVSQLASLGVNSLSAAAGVFGNVTQQSNGLVSTVSNVQSGSSGFCSVCGMTNPQPAYAVGSGNTVIASAVQINNQSLNTAVVGGAINGAFNAASLGAVNLSTSNVINSVANLGNARVSGTQQLASAVGVITTTTH